MMLEMIKVLEDINENRMGANRVFEHNIALQEGVKSKQYQLLMSRTKCSKFSTFSK